MNSKVLTNNETKKTGHSSITIPSLNPIWSLSTVQQRVLIDHIFKALAFNFGSKFIQNWESFDQNDLRIYWAQELKDVSADGFEKALKALEGMDHPPSLPAFKSICSKFSTPKYRFKDAIWEKLDLTHGWYGIPSEEVPDYEKNRMGSHRKA